jgi:hypothetical protein
VIGVVILYLLPVMVHPIHKIEEGVINFMDWGGLWEKKIRELLFQDFNCCPLVAPPLGQFWDLFGVGKAPELPSSLCN